MTHTICLFGYKIIIYCNESTNEAAKLAGDLNRLKPNSSQVIKQIFSYASELKSFSGDCVRLLRRLDVVLNNAFAFLPTPLDSPNPGELNALIHFYLNAPLIRVNGISPRAMLWPEDT